MNKCKDRINTVLIRVDGGNKIGMGHVMRCLTLARSLRKNFIHILFVSSNEESKYIVEKSGFQFISLNSIGNIEYELPKLKDIIDRLNINLCIVDNYNATDYYYEQLQSKVATVVIDGESKCKVEVSLIINPNIGIGRELYYKRGLKNTEILSGINYSFVRDSFYKKRKECISSHVKRVLFTVGGSDSYHVTLKMIDEITERRVFNNMEFYFIIGPYFDDYTLKKLENMRINNIHICRNIMDLSDLMSKMDLIITAGGTTVFEVMSLAIPSIVFAIAENQYDAGRLTRYINWFGDIRNDKLDKIDMEKLKSMVNYISDIIIDFPKQQEKFYLIKREFDGRGIERITSSLLRHLMR